MHFFQTERVDNLNEFWFFDMPLEEISPDKNWPTNVPWTLALLIEFNAFPEIFSKILTHCKSIKTILCKNYGDVIDISIYGKQNLTLETGFNIGAHWDMNELLKFGFVGNHELMVWKRNF